MRGKPDWRRLKSDGKKGGGGGEAGSVDHTSKEFCCKWEQREAKEESGIKRFCMLMGMMQ